MRPDPPPRRASVRQVGTPGGAPGFRLANGSSAVHGAARMPVKCVQAELLRRKLSTLDGCRALWEAAGDPLALAAAVMLSADLPRWLQVYPAPRAHSQPLTPPIVSRRLKKVWAASNRDRLHARRAWERHPL